MKNLKKYYTGWAVNTFRDYEEFPKDVALIKSREIAEERIERLSKKYDFKFEIRPCQ